MNPFEFVIAIIVIAFIFRLVQMRMEHKHERSQRSSGEPADDLLGRLVRLEERIQVLERIITDDRAHLRREFEDLSK